MHDISNLGIHSGYDKEGKFPFVCLHFKDVPPFQVEASDAISIANMLTDSAVGAISASFFFEFLTEKMNIPPLIADIATKGFVEYFEQQVPSAAGPNHAIAEQLDGYSDYLYDLLIKRGDAPLDINEWVAQQRKEPE